MKLWTFDENRKESYGFERCYACPSDYKYVVKSKKIKKDESEIIYSSSLINLQKSIINLAKIVITNDNSAEIIYEEVSIKDLNDNILTIMIPLIYSKMIQSLKIVYKIIETSDNYDQNKKKLNNLFFNIIEQLFKTIFDDLNINYDLNHEWCYLNKK